MCIPDLHGGAGLRIWRSRMRRRHFRFPFDRSVSPRTHRLQRDTECPTGLSQLLPRRFRKHIKCRLHHLGVRGSDASLRRFRRHATYLMQIRQHVHRIDYDPVKVLCTTKMFPFVRINEHCCATQLNMGMLFRKDPWLLRKQSRCSSGTKRSASAQKQALSDI